MNELFIKQRAYSTEISELRKKGELLQAIKKGEEAISVFPDNSFFHKILGDMYLQNDDYESSCTEYIELLKLVPNNLVLFEIFKKYYYSLKDKANENVLHTFTQRIQKVLQEKKFPKDIENWLISILGDNVMSDPEFIGFLHLTDDDNYYKQVRNNIEKWENERNFSYINAVVSHRLGSKDQSKSKKINKYLIDFLEKAERFSLALSLIEASQQPYNFTMQSKILRICRRMSSYVDAERLLNIDDEFITRSDFNVEYELVYYFQHKNDPENLDKVLREMRFSAKHSIPIARTLYNFYLSFDKFDEAQMIYEHIKQLELSLKNTAIRKRQAEQTESEQYVWQKLKDLVSDQEHNRQMMALRDLLKGFSHELGQPITNIRYSIQLQQIKMQKGIDTREEINILLASVLEQTARIGSMLSRFRPIVSNKSESSFFSIKKCIEQVFNDLRIRLDNQNITFNITGSDEIQLFGDAVQFSQVFYNLIHNSMQAMNCKGVITVDILDKKKNIKIYFSDSGSGIPREYHKKIFEPFFSTKDPTSGNGGEGLGLFIVWNILKMFGGTIHIDDKYASGARFIITLPITKE